MQKKTEQKQVRKLRVGLKVQTNQRAGRSGGSKQSGMSRYSQDEIIVA